MQFDVELVNGRKKVFISNTFTKTNNDEETLKKVSEIVLNS